MPNSVDEFLEAKKKLPSAKRGQEHELWHQWNNSGRKPEHLEPLIKAYQPVVQAKIREWKAPKLVQSAFEAELRTHLIKAFESYDPNRGASLRTHVEKPLLKALRYVVKNQNVAYIPEGQTSNIGKLQRARDELHEELGRDPTPTELADRVNETYPRARLTTKRVEDIQRNIIADRPSSTWSWDPTAKPSSREQEVLDLIQAELHDVFPHPEERLVFEHIYGLNGKAQISATNDLAKKLGKSPSQISRLKSSVGARVKSYL
jgi:DNA-directed RNA polymerase specialized sigma subunit